MQYKDYYEIMGLKRDAPAEEIKRCYRKLARKYHPDVSKEKDAEDHFKEIGEAYEVLKDPKKRSAYDRLGAQWQAGENFRPPPDWQGQGFDPRSGGFADGDNAQFSDFFEQLFGGRHARGGRSHPGEEDIFGRRHGGGTVFRRPGEDLHSKVALDLEDAFKGTTQTLSLQMPEVDAQGITHHKPRTLKIKIPAGVTSGQQIRLAGQGAPGSGGGANGDLYLEITFKDHAFFRVEKQDVHLTLPITPWEAALGATISVPTLGGKVDMKIVAGSQSGQKMRLKGRGLPGKHPGDQFILLQIMTPVADTNEQREFYQSMAKEFHYNPRARLLGPSSE